MKPIPFQPVGSRVLIRPQAPPSEIGGILLPENLQGRGSRGLVVAVGANVTKDYFIKPGQTVLLPEHGGKPVKVNGESLDLYPACNIGAILHE